MLLSSPPSQCRKASGARGFPPSNKVWPGSTSVRQPPSRTRFGARSACWDITRPRRRGLSLFPAASGGLREALRLAAPVKIFGCSRISGTARHDPRLPRGLGRWALRLGSASPFRSRLPGFAPSQRRTRLAPLLVLPLSDITVAGFTPILAAQLPPACSRLCHQVHGPVGRTCHHEVAACVS